MGRWGGGRWGLFCGVEGRSVTRCDSGKKAKVVAAVLFRASLLSSLKDIRAEKMS